MPPFASKPAGGIIQDSAEDADIDDRDDQFTIGHAVAGIQNEITESRLYAQHFGRNKDDPDYPDFPPSSSTDPMSGPTVRAEPAMWFQAVIRAGYLDL